ncbi:hypothetical protein GCM10008931_44890 [Oceanobacillus oncorhynchi subsp. oncorhynchi]
MGFKYCANDILVETNVTKIYVPMKNGYLEKINSKCQHVGSILVNGFDSFNIGKLMSLRRKFIIFSLI